MSGDAFIVSAVPLHFWHFKDSESIPEPPIHSTIYIHQFDRSISSPSIAKMAKIFSSQQWESALDGISNLTLGRIDIPLPRSGEVLVQIKAVSLNYKDGETIEGQFNHHKAVELPRRIVPCADAAGVIFAIGDGVTRWKKGDRVLSVSYPEYLTGRITEEMLRDGIGSSGKGCLLLLDHKSEVRLGIVLNK
jgi:hypothetical protein